MKYAFVGLGPDKPKRLDKNLSYQQQLKYFEECATKRETRLTTNAKMRKAKKPIGRSELKALESDGLDGRLWKIEKRVALPHTSV